MPNEFSNPDSHSLTPLGNQKPTTRKKAGKQSDRAGTEDSLLGFVRKVDREIVGFEGEAEEIVRGIAKQKAQSLRKVVGQLPTIYHEEVQKELGSLEVDPECFRSSSGTLRGRLYAAVGISEADKLVVERLP